MEHVLRSGLGVSTLEGLPLTAGWWCGGTENPSRLARVYLKDASGQRTRNPLDLEWPMAEPWAERGRRTARVVRGCFDTFALDRPPPSSFTPCAG